MGKSLTYKIIEINMVSGSAKQKEELTVKVNQTDSGFDRYNGIPAIGSDGR